MIELKSKDYPSVEKMLSKFKKKVKESQLLIELKERQRHVSKKDKKRKKKKQSIYRKQQSKNKKERI
jgi:ribosomal protein S21